MLHVQGGADQVWSYGGQPQTGQQKTLLIGRELKQFQNETTLIFERHKVWEDWYYSEWASA